ncbi:baseplate J/gp47 family protein [Pseudomonas stutzeri]|uniref:baseplate J/gp47 family protein n=1 Tax=Stutzerimonas stutzeri TaxID=316 RepID=UPI00210C30AE|nr:baseplate J/gp47 family protein [Stutzerimonas stutzeri]MCQ4310925.1 baseplate J/gp47 family protein [Stutzerimonas stutzeri]
MPFPIPTLEQTRQQIGSDIEAHLPGTEARTRRSTLGVLAFAEAGAVQGLHAHIEHRWRNMLPDEQADAEGVERWARRYKLWYRDPIGAAGQVQIAGAIGATVLAGTTLQHSQDLIYTVRETVTLTASSGLMTVDAQTLGAAGNLPAGTRLTFLSPVTGIQAAATVTEDRLTGGTDLETLDGLRSRVHRRMAEPPQGGSLTDYETWALESHPAITRVWATEHEQGSGSVVVRIVCDNQDDPIPSAAVLEACAAYIAVRRPAGRRSVYVLPPVAVAQQYQIRAVPNTVQVKAAIEAELRDLHRREAEPGGLLLLSHIREAVSIATGERDNSVLSPSADVQLTTGQMATFGGITWA